MTNKAASTSPAAARRDKFMCWFSPTGGESAGVYVPSLSSAKQCDLFRVAMHARWRERWQADCDIFGALRQRRRILHPFARMRDDGLPRAHVELAVLVRHAQHAGKDDGEL